MGGAGVEAAASNGWGSKERSEDRKRAAVRSAIVSVTAQRYLGESTHPIGSTRGKATRAGSLWYRGRRAPRVGMDARWIQTRMKASATSVFDKKMGPRRVSAR